MMMNTLSLAQFLLDRVDFLELNVSKAVKFSGGFYKCIKDNIFILNTLNGPHESLCEFQNYTGTNYGDL